MKKHEQHNNHDRWLVSYADFITLLFAFFVVLYATSTQNQAKEKIFESSIRSEMHMQGEGTGANAVKGMFDSSFDAVDLLQQRGVGNGELSDYVNRLLQKKMTAEELQNNLGGIRYDADGVRIILPAASYFNSGSAKIRRAGLPSLDAIAEILKQSPKRLMIEGHTDNQPVEIPVVSGKNDDTHHPAVKAAFETNWELAGARATAVVRYLIGTHGLPADRLAAVSYADQRPLVPNDSDEDRAKNRRIEILIQNVQMSMPEKPDDAKGDKAPEKPGVIKK